MTARPAPSIKAARPDAEAWRRRAPELATWLSRLVNRIDVWGGYDPVRTSPRKEFRGKLALNDQILQGHFRARLSRDIIGLHTTSPENTSRFGAIEVDNHDDESEVAHRNLTAILAWRDRLIELGFTPPLEDSDGQGGFKLWIVFHEPVATATVFAFLQWIVGDYKDHGLVARPETFPKQPAIPPDGFGNWIRPPGRHHKREHWSRFWNGAEWLQGDAAVEHLLNTPLNDVMRIPEEALPQSEEPKQKPAAKRHAPGTDLLSEEEIVLRCVARIPNNDVVYDDWIKVLAAARSAGSNGRVHAAALEWSQRSAKHDDAKFEKTWKSLRRTDGNVATVGTLVHLAKENGCDVYAERKQELREKHRDTKRPAVLSDLKSTGRLLSDIGNAARFAIQHGQNVRFCHQWGKWIYWNSNRWVPDERGYIVKLAKQTALSILDEAKAAPESARDAIISHAKKAQMRERVAAMIDLAKPELAIASDELDADPSLLNTQSETLDLRTGNSHLHRREDYITKICRVSYARVDAPVFKKFLNRIFRTHPALIGYMQKVFGYAATGMTIEQVVFFLYGAGSNGKTTLLDAVQYALGDYSGKADRELLSASDRGSPQHPTNIADLQGKRLVTCSETNDGTRLDEAKLKDLSGETRMKARKMFKDFFEFTATHKIFLYSNHKPIVRGTDHGFWRRMRLIPFIETIADEEKDSKLPEKLQAEASGILAWIVEGCRRWREEGLDFPDEVKKATKLYQEEMDSIGLFIDEDCVEVDAAYAIDLYTAYARWCEEAGERPLSQKRLGTQLAERGYVSDRCGKTNRRTWTGIRLKTPEEKKQEAENAVNGSAQVNA